MERVVGKENMEFFDTLFKTLDKDQSGVLDKKELVLALEACTSNKEDQDFLMGLADADNSGTLNRTEFMFLMIIAEADIDDCRKSSAAFDKYNSDGNNVLDKTEVRNLLNDLRQEASEADFEELFNVLDFDNSGKLNKVEFHMLYMALKPKFEEAEMAQ